MTEKRDRPAQSEQPGSGGFEEGQETQPNKTRVGQFSDGNEQLPDKKREGQFSDFVEPEEAKAGDR
jgi:hypothetical protein